MKISIIGPATQIPPIGWGAVESLIWDYKLTLEKLGHQVKIINVGNPMEIIQNVNSFKPDFVHINYDDWIAIYPYIQYLCACTTHYGYLENQDMMGGYVNIFNLFGEYKPNIFCLSPGIMEVYKTRLNIPEQNLYLNPNGVNVNNFKFRTNPKYSDKSIYLAKIDYRKRQYLFQSIDSLWYAGNIADQRFDTQKNYLGEWSKEILYNNLTDYGNLVLLRDGEAHPLVCMEAFASGLGVVVSEYATANLDLDKNFIDVIPESRINDISYIESVIIKNRKYSVQNRKEILQYAKTFEWENIIKTFFIPNIERLLKTK